MTATKETAYAVAKRTEDKVDQILVLLGQEAEDGKGGYVATGLFGRVRRMEDKQRTVLARGAVAIATGAGFTACLAALGSFVAIMVRGFGLHFPGVK